MYLNYHFWFFAVVIQDAAGNNKCHCVALLCPFNWRSSFPAPSICRRAACSMLTESLPACLRRAPGATNQQNNRRGISSTTRNTISLSSWSEETAPTKRSGFSGTPWSPAQVLFSYPGQWLCSMHTQVCFMFCDSSGHQRSPLGWMR